MTSPLALYELGGHPIAALLPESGGEPIPVIYMLTGADPMLELSSTLKALKSSGEALGPQFAVVGVGSLNWNTDYAPWPAPAVMAHDAAFGGGADTTLDFLAGTVMPWIENRCQDGILGCGIIGYSMAGLTALYAMYQLDVFDACACCSGSLWFDHWLTFMRQHHPSPTSGMYLSLGRQEEKTRNSRMAVIGSATREAASILASDPNVRESTLLYHNGGHFNKIPERVGAGISWLCQNLIKYQ